MTTDERFDRIEQAIERLTKSVEERFARVDESIERLAGWFLKFREETLQRFDSMERRLSLLELTTTSMDTQLTGLTKATQHAGAQVDHLMREQARQGYGRGTCRTSYAH